MVKAKIERAGVHIDDYLANFEGVDADRAHEKYGPGWFFRFGVERGRETGTKCKGEIVGRTTKARPTLKNSAGVFLAGLAGRTPDEGLDLDSDNFVGDEFIIRVGESPESGSSRVEKFWRVDTLDADDLPEELKEHGAWWEDAPADVDKNSEEGAADEDGVPF